ncbi:hypothetical protein M3Y98_01199900 [Aphelenchoides besseyi]|nr:hypothetical protein M3Y98_01199900 [Aphelenchoides besseyi]
MFLSRYTPLPQPHFSAAESLFVSSIAPNGSALIDAVSMQNCTDGVKWILNIFGDCVDTNLKLAGFVIGFLSLILWLVPVLPQLYENYRAKRCEGISIFFLLFWMTGDLCNMIGAILTHQQPLQQIIAVYYIFQDIALLSQYVYYTKIFAGGRSAMISSTIVVPMIFVGVIGTSALRSDSSFASEPIELGGKMGRSLLSARSGHLGGVPIFDSYSDAVGYAIGSIAAVCYFAGRVPQLLRNYYRKSCDGLSLAMFYIIVLANLTYGMSVIMEATDWNYIWRHMPWLIGSLGCCFFDMIVIGQYYHYQRRRAEGVLAEEREGLIQGDEEDDPEI